MIKQFILTSTSYDEFIEFEKYICDKKFNILYLELDVIHENAASRLLRPMKVKLFKSYESKNMPCEEVSLQDNYGRVMYYMNQPERKEKGGYKIPHLKFLV